MSNGYFHISTENTEYLGLLEGEPCYKIKDPFYKKGTAFTKPIYFDFDALKVYYNDTSTVIDDCVRGYGSIRIGEGNIIDTTIWISYDIYVNITFGYDENDNLTFIARESTRV